MTLDTRNNELNSYSKLEKALFYIAILSFSLFPLIPNKYKGYSVLFLLVSALTAIIFTKGLFKKINFKYAFIFSSIYFLYIISLIYSENIGYGLKKLETGASILIIPFCFSILYTRFKDLTKNGKSFFIYGFIIGASIYATSIIYYFNYLGFAYCRKNLSHCLSYLDGMFVLSEHPIYGSMFAAVGVIFIINNYGNQNVWVKSLFFIGLLVNLYVLLLLVRKGVILALVISFLAFLFNLKIVKHFNYKKALLLLAVLAILIFNFKDSIQSRFSELSKSLSYERIDENNSTSIRYSIYNCALNVISENVFFGQGIGDTSDALIECYKNKSTFLVTNKFNSHNQYFGILLSIGLFGFCFFLFILFVLYRRAINNKDVNYIQILMFFSVLFLTENILERQSGLILFYFIVNYLFYFNLYESGSKFDFK